MAISDIPIFSMLRTRLAWAQERQRVLAENVANSDTPNYRARDLAAPKFPDPSQLALAPTEDPSQKRLEDALKRGDVVKSQEVNTWFVIAGATLVLMAFSGGMSEGLTTTTRGLMANAHDIRVDGPALPRLFQKLGIEMLAAIAIPFLLLMLAALCGNMIQHQLVWSTEALSPKSPRFRRSPASSGCSPSRRCPISPRAWSSWC